MTVSGPQSAPIQIVSPESVLAKSLRLMVKSLCLMLNGSQKGTYCVAHVFH